MKFKFKSNYVRLSLALFGGLALFWLFYKVVSSPWGIFDALISIVNLAMPLVVGLIMAYLLAPLYDLVQKPCYRLFCGKSKTPRRHAKGASKAVATLVSVLFLLALIVGLLSLVIPEAIVSISELAESLPDRAKDVIEWAKNIGEQYKDNALIASLSDSVGDVTQSLTDWAHNVLLPSLGNFAVQFSTGLVGFIGTIGNVCFGLIICIYALNSKELFAAQAKKIAYSFFKVPTANYLIHMTRFIDQTFGRYLNGMLVDASVLGTLVFLGMSIFGFHYAPLVAVVIGVCNLIPMIGPIIGVSIGCFFLLLKDPLQALLFVVFFVIVQQIHYNLISPRILGGKIGISSFWIMFSIVIGGGLLGPIGMILGVPTFAVIYMLFRQYVARRLRRKSIPDDTRVYFGLWDIDETTGEPKYVQPDEEITVPQYQETQSETETE